MRVMSYIIGTIFIFCTELFLQCLPMQYSSIQLKAFIFQVLKEENLKYGFYIMSVIRKTFLLIHSSSEISVWGRVF